MLTKTLRYLWALPATCVGASLGLLCLARGARVRVAEGAIEVAGPVPALPGVGCITFGHVIIGRSFERLAEWRAHEQVHVRQYERWGVLFFPLYAGSSAWAWVRGRDPYRDNVFEREAFGLGSRLRGNDDQPGDDEVIPPPGGGSTRT